MYRGYIYNSEGTKHSNYVLFKESPENIANFIIYNVTNPTVITDEADQFIASSTIGGFLDRVSSPKLRNEICEFLVPLQFGEIEAVNPADGE